jgi:acetyl-CoA synthetase
VTGVPDQIAWDARSFDEARAQHRWKVPAVYNIAADCVHRWAADPAKRDAPALVWDRGDGRTTTYSWVDADREVRRAANALRSELGVRPGDVVALLLPQRPETAFLHMAVFHLGAVSLPISKLYGSDAVEYRLRHASARVVVVDDESRLTINPVLGRLPDLRHVVTVGAPQSAADRSYDDLIRRASPRSEPAATRPDQPAILMYTSGTTGQPKGCLHGQRVSLGHANLGYSLDLPRPDDVYYSHADWSWVAGLMNGLLATWGFGLTVVCCDGRFDPAALTALVERHGVTCGLYTPGVLRQLAEHSPPSAHRLRCAVSGGELVTPEVSQWALENFTSAFNVGFGQTEVNDLIGNVSLWEAAPIGPLGRPLPGHEVALLDEDDQPVAQGATGEIAVRLTDDNPAPMLRYHLDPTSTAAKFRSGWLHTGDLGTADESGFISFASRTDDVIKTSGYRVGPGEVEACLLSHPAVRECAVIGVPDPSRGQSVVAHVVVRAAGDAQLARELQDFVRSRVGHHAYPRAVHFSDALPKTVTGKVIRAQLRAQASDLAEVVP